MNKILILFGLFFNLKAETLAKPTSAEAKLETSAKAFKNVIKNFVKKNKILVAILIFCFFSFVILGYFSNENHLIFHIFTVFFLFIFFFFCFF